MTYVNVALAILLFINGALCLNSCIKLPQQFLDADTTEDELFELIKSDEGEAIDWWFLVKPPQTSLFLYFDSAMEADNQPMVVVPEARINPYLLWHATIGHNENLDALNALFKIRDMNEIDRLIKLPKDEEYAPTSLKKAKVLQLHISNDHKKVKRGTFRTRPTDDIKPYRYSHGKGLLSVRLADGAFGDSFYLQHSLTQTPDVNVKKGLDYIGLAGFTLRSQHAFCTSIKAASVPSLMQTLAVSAPRVVAVNLDELIIDTKVGEQNMKFVTDIISPPLSKKCLDQWTEILNVFREGRVNDVLDDFVPEVCISPLTTYNTNGIPVVVIPHVALPHASFKLPLNKNQKISDDPCHPTDETPAQTIDRTNKDEWNDEEMENEDLSAHITGRGYEAVYLGPIPWLTTSFVIDAPLMISVWKHGDDLPSILAKHCVYLVEDVCYTATDDGDNQKFGWGHHQMHEKLGVSADATKKWVCFGDSNHRFSEISHAGITICLKAPNLWQIMFVAVKSVNAYNPIITDDTRCSMDTVSPVSMSNPITKWEFYKGEQKKQQQHHAKGGQGR
jgi:hypothetical protein